MANENQTVLTKDGAEKLKEELNTLINVERPQVVEALAAARAQGDLKENADYDAARNRQAEVEGRIKEIENILANAKIVRESTNNDKSVGTVEADPLGYKISNECPLGLALIGHKAGDEVEVKSKISYKVKILNVERDK